MAEKSFPFIHRGIITRTTTSELPQGATQSEANCESLQEGSICSRAGIQSLGSSSGLNSPSVRKFRIGATDSTNPRYVLSAAGGSGMNLYRTAALNFSALTNIASNVSSTSLKAQRFNLASYSAGTSGQLWAFISTPLAMLKDPSPGTSTPQNWGILPATGVAQASASGTGVLDGGASGSPSGSSPYDYIYCYRNKTTGNQGNPSQTMLTVSNATNGTPVAVHLQQITVTVWGSGDAQISGSGSIAIYRRGGIFTDGLYRFVGYATNPGSATSTTFVDNASDVSIELNPTVEFDNDPPVPSGLQNPYTGAIQANSSAGFQTVTLSPALPSGLTPGSTMFCVGNKAIETVIILSVVSSTQVEAYFQLNHTSGEIFTIDTICNQALPYSVSAFDSIFLAGDPNNPHILYKSKTGMPESFPIEEADGIADAIIVGSPANPIQNICEFRDMVVSLNLNSLYVVPVISGQMLAPSEVSQGHGLLDPWAWCKSDNAIWYLSNDGIYEFDGNSSRKISEAIDQLFVGRSLGNLPPINFNPTTTLPIFRLEYYHQEIWFSYFAVGFGQICLRYQALYNRWIIAEFNGGVSDLWFEPDTGNLMVAGLLGGNASFAFADKDGTSGTTDYWSTNGTDGQAIPAQFKTGFFYLDSPAVDKLFQDIILELDAPAPTSTSSYVTVSVYYDFSSTAADTFTLSDNATAGVTGRHRVSLMNALSGGVGQGVEAYAVAFEFIVTCKQRVTFYSLTFQYEILAEAQSGKPGLWQNLGHPYDKRLQEVTIEYSNYGFTTLTAYVDIMSGINSLTETTQIASAVLAPTPAGTRALATIPLADIICKLCRITYKNNEGAAVVINESNVLRVYGDPKWSAVNDPPDILEQTQWRAYGPCESIARQVRLAIDTGGVNCTVALQGDGTTQQSFTVNATDSDRKRFFSTNSNLICRMWRYTFTPGSGGKAKVFENELDAIPEPCPITSVWDSYELVFSYQGWKAIKILNLQWICAASSTLSIYREGDALFYAITLPPQSTRDPQRFLLPSLNSGVLNKSRSYRMVLNVTSPLKFYPDGSRIEWIGFGLPRHRALQQQKLSELLSPMAG